MALDEWTFDPDGTTGPIAEYHYRESFRDSGAMSLGDNPQTDRVFIVRGDQFAEFVDDLVGYSVPGEDGRLERVLPDEHPKCRLFYATDPQVTMKGTTTVSGNESVWDLAYVKVTYKPVPYKVKPDEDVTVSETERFVSYQYQTKNELLTANNVGMQFVSRSSEKSVQTSPSINVPSSIVTMTWHNLPPDPFDEFSPPNIDLWQEVIGTCNDAQFNGYAPQTLLLIDVQPVFRMPRLSDGIYVWDLAYTFECRDFGPGVGSERAGVNYIYDFANSRWDLITVDGTDSGQRLYRTSDFSELFKFQA